MARKYIKQIINQNFIYPNDDVSEYDIEIIHDINNNSISGTVANLTATTVSSTSITFRYNWTWAKNNAEPYIRSSGNISLLSVHLLANGQDYYKPWRLVDEVSSSTITGATYSGTNHSFTVTPSQMGLTSFTNDIYYFEFRFIGHRVIYPVCAQYTVGVIPTPTPTPTPTITHTPTPTPTPTEPPGYTTGSTLNVTDTGYIKYSMSSGTTYQYIGSIGTVVLTNCLDCTTIREGIPFADLAIFTIVNCGNPCDGPPPPTPTPTVGCFSPKEYNITNSGDFYWTDCDGIDRRTYFTTGTVICICDDINLPVSYNGGTGTLAGGGCVCPTCNLVIYGINNTTSPYEVYWSGEDCDGNPLYGTVAAFTNGYTRCLKETTLSYTGSPTITVNAYC